MKRSMALKKEVEKLRKQGTVMAVQLVTPKEQKLPPNNPFSVHTHQEPIPHRRSGDSATDAVKLGILPQSVQLQRTNKR